MKALKELYELEFETRYKDRPDYPDYAKFKKRFSDRTSNQLTQAIKTFLQLKGWHCERINVQGRPLDQTRVVTNTLGQKQRIGSISWIKGTGTPGSSDLHCLINGKAVFIEIKIGRDQQSEAQRRYEKTVQRAGGKYWLVRSFDEFIQQYNKL